MLMLDFPFILFFLTVASGLVVLVEKFYFSKKRASVAAGDIPTLPLLIDYSKSLFPVFIIVLVLRSFVGQLYMVPSGSLMPTIKVGEYLLVIQYPYGIHLPVWNKTIVNTGEPKRGDIVVFHWPVNPRVDFIKRVVGIPGDKISYINKVLYINGKPATQKLLQLAKYGDYSLQKWHVKEIEENLAGVKHKIYVCAASATRCPEHSAQNFYNLVIPKNEYLMMGDNRDDSDDGRYWGLVNKKYLVGKAKYVVFSWNATGTWIPFTKVRWQRIGTKIV